MELIDRHFDQLLTAQERETLEEKLLTDRDSAAAFARAARLDHSLEAILTEAASESDLTNLITLLQTRVPPSHISRPSVTTATAIAAAAVLCFAILYLWPRDTPREPRSAATADAPNAKRVERPSVRLAQTRLTAILPTEAETDNEAEARIRQRLSRFYLPTTDIQDLPLDVALESLQKTFYSVDALGWSSEEAIEFTVASKAGDDLTAVTLTRSNISVLSALNLLAIQSGHEVKFAPPKIHLVAKKPEPDEGDADASGFVTRTFSIPPGMLESGPYRDPRSREPSDSLVREIGYPNEEPGEKMVTWHGELGVQEYFQFESHWGIETPAGGSPVMFNESGQMLIRNTQPNLDRLAELISEATGRSASSSPITISTKLVTLPSELVGGGTDRIVNAGEWELILRNWQQQKLVAPVSSPSVTTHIGQPSNFKMFTTRFVEVNQEPGGENGAIQVIQPIGLDLPFNTRASGEQITLMGKIDQSFHEADLPAETLDKLGGSDPDSPTVHFITEIEAPLYPGQVALFECECHEPDKKLIAAVSVSWGAAIPMPPDTDGR